MEVKGTHLDAHRMRGLRLHMHHGIGLQVCKKMMFTLTCLQVLQDKEDGSNGYKHMYIER